MKEVFTVQVNETGYFACFESEKVANDFLDLARSIMTESADTLPPVMKHRVYGSDDELMRILIDGL